MSSLHGGGGDDIVIRSLRRRLWRALQEEDVDSAIRAYTATRADLAAWEEQERAAAAALAAAAQELEASREPKEKPGERPKALRRLSSWRRSPRTSQRRLEERPSLRGFKSEPDPPTTPMDEKRYDSHSCLLQLEMNPSESFVPDDFKSPSDSYSEEEPPLPKPEKAKAKHRRKKMSPRLAFGLLKRRKNAGPVVLQQLDDMSSTSSTDSLDEQINSTTTPLHEAARLGSGTLVRLMLANDANPNVRNGKLRTALHMVAGGLTEAEEGQIMAMRAFQQEGTISGTDMNEEVGIRKPIPPADLADTDAEESPASNGPKRAVKAVGRFFRQGLRQNSSMEENDHDEKLKRKLPALDRERIVGLAADRMDALLAILSWVHPDDGSPSARDGMSVNSVDARGRTALHYAAELGRDDICMATLSSFGTMLTIVDESSRTPCELAGENGFDDLASQLEARALLYIDPYGLDDDLMASVLAGDKFDGHRQEDGGCDSEGRPLRHVTKNLAPPFCWFETWNTEEVQREREWRVTHLRGLMRSKLRELREFEEATDFLLSHGIEDPLDGPIETSGMSDVQGIGDTQDNEMHMGTYAELTDAPYDAYPANGAGFVSETPLAEFEVSRGASDIEPGESGKLGDFGTERLNEDAEKRLEGKLADSGADNLAEDAVKTLEGKPSATEFEENVEVTLESKSSDSDGKQELEEDAGIGLEPKLCDSGNKHLDEDGIASVQSKPSAPDTNHTESDTGIALESRFTTASTTRPSVHEAHAERLLEYHHWDMDAAYEAFWTDPDAAMKSAGVDFALTKPTTKSLAASTDVTKMCLICCEEFASGSSEWRQLRNCLHEFCGPCLADYIAEYARTRSSGLTIVCPHHECTSLLAPDEIVELAPDMAVYEALVEAANEHFVSSASDLKYCPHPGCHGIVKRFLPEVVVSGEIDPGFVDITGAVCTAHSDGAAIDRGAPLTYEGVRDENYFRTRDAQQPRKAHRFCFGCGSHRIHWPISCEVLENWNADVASRVGEADRPDETYEDVAQRLWLKTNTRPCPKCKAPIEKNDGCNHMTCTNRHCRYEFCWICQKDWKLHNTQTGGFFRCNRWIEEEDHEYYDTPPPPEDRVRAADDSSPSEQRYGTALHSSIVAAHKNQEMNRFLHHYSRYSAHGESAALEGRMATTVCSRLAPVIEAAIEFNGHGDFDFAGRGLSFVHAAFVELWECRSLLRHSYVFAYYRYPKYVYIRRNRPVRLREREKMTFEQYQADLEVVTEHLSDIVARSHLRATQTQIMFLTSGAAEKRRDFTTLMLTILNDEAEEKRSVARYKPPVIEDDGVSPFDQPTQFEDHTPRPRVLFMNQGRMRPELFPATAVRAGIALPSQPFEPHVDVDEALEEAMRAAGMPITMQPPPEENTRSNYMITSEYAWTQWSCPACTYVNIGGRNCAMCSTPRG